MKKKKYYIILTLIVFFLCLLYSFIGFYPEDHTDSELSIHHNGIFLNSPVTLFNNWNVFTLITYPIVWLKLIFPQYNIHGITLCILTLLYLFNYLYFSTNFIKFKNRNLFIILSFLLLTLFCYDIIFNQYLKISMHLIASSILCFNITNTNKYKLYFIFTFFIGLCIRYEAFFVILFYLIFIYFILYNKLQFYKIIKIVKSNIVFFIILITVILFASFSYTKQDRLYKPYHTPINSIGDFRIQDFKINSFSQYDSAKFKMLIGYYYNDTIGIKPSDFNKFKIASVKRNPIDLIKYFNIKNRLETGSFDFYNYLNSYRYYYFIYLFTILSLVLFIDRSKLLKIIICLLFLFALLFSMSVYMEIQPRFALPLSTLNAFIIIVFLFQNSNIQIIKNNLFILLIAITYTLLNTYNIYFPIKSLKENYQRFDGLVNKINANNYNTVIWDFYLFSVFNKKNTDNFENYTKYRDYCMDFPFGFALNSYHEYMKIKFGDSNFDTIINYLVNNKNAICIYEKQHLSTQINYFNIKNNRNIKLQRIDNLKLSINNFSIKNNDYYGYYLIEDIFKSVNK